MGIYVSAIIETVNVVNMFVYEQHVLCSYVMEGIAIKMIYIRCAT